MEVTNRWHSPFIVSVIFSLFSWYIPPFSLLIVGIIASSWFFYKKSYLTCAILFGFCWFFIHANLALSWQLPKFLYKQPITLIGTIDNIPILTEQTYKFDLKISAYAGVELQWPQQAKVKLNWTFKPKQAPLSLKLGDTLELTAKLKPPHGFANQGGFSYQKWLLLKGIRATGYVDNKLLPQRLSKAQKLRQTLYDKIEQSTKQLKYQGLILALSMGEKHLISKAQWQLIKASGISHLLAISGLHIGMIFMFASVVSLWLSNSLALALKLDLNGPRFALVCGLICAGFYAWMAGFAIATLRAVMMLSLLVLMLYTGRTGHSRTVVLTTLALILLLDPLSILQSSLWLSFTAVLTILLTFWWFGRVCFVKRSKVLVYLSSLVIIQVAMLVMMLPVTVLIFNGFSLSGGWINLLAVPWVSFVTVPLSLMAAILEQLSIGGGLLYQGADASLALLFWLIEQPFVASGWLNVAHITWYHWLMLMLWALCWLVELSPLTRFASMSLLLPSLLHWLSWPLDDQSWQVHVLDVGQGLAVVIEQNDKIVIYDLGPVYKSGFNTVDQVILPFMAYHGFDEVDILIISHSDSDHAGAYQRLLQQTKVNRIIAPKQLALSQPSEPCAGQAFYWQGSYVQMLWPWPQTPLSKISNDRSCVVKVSYNDQQLLLTGDISKRVEKKLVRGDLDAQLKSDVLIAPHHGSLSSSSDIFIRAVSPQLVVFSAGNLNRYRFPRPEIVSRYKKRQIERYHSAKSGQISITFDGQRLKIKEHRKDQLKHWYYSS